jgi:hypothetical protein
MGKSERAAKELSLVREKLVAHLKDGEIFKGYSGDFQQAQESFHLFSSDEPVARSRRIDLDDLKALFFVRTWGRTPGRVQRKYHFGVGGMRSEPGRRVAVRFRDGERIWGYVPADADRGPGFYLIPADPQDNNIKIFIVHSSVDEMHFLDPVGATLH